MKLRTQIVVLSACLAACLALTVTLLIAENMPPPPQPRVLLAANPLPQIEVPLGLMPIPELSNPTFGMEDGRIVWIDAEQAGYLAMVYSGKQPEAWPVASRKIERIWLSP